VNDPANQTVTLMPKAIEPETRHEKQNAMLLQCLQSGCAVPGVTGHASPLRKSFTWRFIYMAMKPDCEISFHVCRCYVTVMSLWMDLARTITELAKRRSKAAQQ